MATLGPRTLVVDKVDLAILRDLAKAGSGQFRSQKATVDAVAEGLGLHPNTVMGRIKRLQEGGGMGSRWTILPQPSVVGFDVGRFFAKLPMAHRTESMLAAVGDLGGIFNIIETLDGLDFGIFAADGDALDAVADKIRAHLGTEPVEWTLRASLDWPILPGIALDDVDLAIFEALLTKGLVAMDDVAATLGLNPRTVHRHHERLRDAQAFRMYPIGEAMMVGLAFRYLQLDLPEPGPERRAAEARLEALLPNCLVRQVLTRGVVFILYADEQGELELQAEAAGKVPGARLAVNRQFRRVIFPATYPLQMMELLRKKVR